jgi:hypothetical protein
MIGFLLSFISACNTDEDGYSLDDAWVGLGLADKSADLNQIVMDDGEILYPLDDYLWQEIKDKDRVLLNFTILDDTNNNHYYVKINSYKKVLYKGILDIYPQIEDSIGNDPIRVNKRWIKNNLLNFELQYRGSGITHYINLVKQPGDIVPGKIVELELRHNNRNDLGDIPLAAIVTFDLSSLKVEGETSTFFKIVAKNFEGADFEYLGEYKY